MALYIKFDRKEEDNLKFARAESFFELFQVMKNQFTLVNSTVTRYEDMPLLTSNVEISFSNLDSRKDELLSFFEEPKNEAEKFGIEIISNLKHKDHNVQISFTLYPENQTRRELPDISISIYADDTFHAIEDLFSTYDMKCQIQNIIKSYQEIKKAPLKIRKAKMTEEEDIFNPQHAFAYYLEPREYIIDLIRYAKINSKLKSRFDLINETKIGTMVYNHENMNVLIKKLYGLFKIKTVAGSLYIIPEESKDTLKFYSEFENKVLRPLSEVMPTRSQASHALNGIDITAFEKK